MQKEYKAYTLQTFRKIPQIQKLPEEILFSIEAVGRVYPFRVNNYVIDELIDWDDIPNDPCFRMTFPQKGMLTAENYNEVASVTGGSANRQDIKAKLKEIYLELNPHPAGQLDENVPYFEGHKLEGVQHKYKETILVFPSQGQTCHAYCSFCFRWPQFVGIDSLKFSMRGIDALIRYLHGHPEISDILFTGGDPLVMKTKVLASYIDAILDADFPHLTTIRIGTKALSYWPYRFLTDTDADDLLKLFTKVVSRNKHLAFMANFNHPRELDTDSAQKAIVRIRETGAEIRTQSPLLANINDTAKVWADMWVEQVRLGCIPYYMFITRDTGAQHYFGVPLAQAWDIFREAYQNTSGLARTARGPIMSTTYGKVQVLGINEIQGEKVFVLQFLQARNPRWVLRPFFANYDANAIWLDELKPFRDEDFFFEKS
uniref:KamA family protein n=1 Tax=Candidatus Kentrum eta TaxID=2126337 RepID=A0A450VFA2_9GAMM|nr:MAG: KamA family protein [Candidatus Kentron sp. H]VFJ97928.1 MAG: KamA family protein [Candidatus Kentron sp. H]VFK03440.1 MAG: KamA family protein [Candidatus Kentron sp. H]